jgi:fructosamine-3-kinase
VTLPGDLDRALEQATGRMVAGARQVGGGCINEAWAVEFADGGQAFVKTRVDVSPDEFATEAAGLRWLAEPGAIGIPAVLAAGGGNRPFLALEWVEEGRLDPAGEEALGQGLARLHAAGAPAFGAAPPGAPGGETAPLRLGAVTLRNDPEAGWPAFYARRRLEPLLAMAVDRQAIAPSGARAVERVIERIDDLAGPPEPPARLHGDLWGGNVLAGADSRPWLIDPAAHGGHREVDLAMLRLFGAPGERTFRAYEEVAPLAPGHEDRVALWQLLPLLVHAVLFGGAYGSQAERAASRYAR